MTQTETLHQRFSLGVNGEDLDELVKPHQVPFLKIISGGIAYSCIKP